MRKTGVFTVALAAIALATSAEAQTVVSGPITADETWGPNPGADRICPIVLDGPVLVGNPSAPSTGATVKTVLTILPGCVIHGQPRDGSDPAANPPGSLIVTQAGFLNAIGSPSSPIIFTTAATDNNADGIPDDVDAPLGFLDPWNPGDVFYDDTPTTAPLAPLDASGVSNVSLWGGLVLLGNAPVNTGTGCATAVEETCNIEGLAIPGFDLNDTRYGGTEPHDSCGDISYISVRHGGDEIGTANELNGITIGGCGDGTLFDHIEVYSNFDDGIEWFGGTINGSHLAVTTVGDDAVDVDQGFTGVNQFIWIVQPWFGETGGTDFGSASGDKMCECDGDDAGSSAGAQPSNNPSSDAWFWNVTGIGSRQTVASPDFTPGAGDQSGVAGNDGWETRHGFGGALANSIIVNTTGNLLDVTDGSDGSSPQTPPLSGANGLGGDWQATAGRVSRCEIQVFATTFDNFDQAQTPTLGAPEDAAIACGHADIRTQCAGGVNAVGLGNLDCTLINSGSFAGLNNVDTSFDPRGDANGKLVPSLKSAPIDPEPAPGFDGVSSSFAQGGAVTTTFRGAFDRSLSTLWVDDWTVLSIAGLVDNN